VKRKLNNVTTYYVYDGEKPILEYNGSGGLFARNVYGKGVDEILARLDVTVNGAHWFYYGQDHEGSATHLINASGDVIESYQYDAFGAITKMWDRNGRIDHTALNNRFLFTGREYAATYMGTYVPAFNFYEYRARAYNPTLGRFMSEDPKLFGAGDYNLFRYCHNDPLDMTDAMGLAGEATGLLQSGTHDRVWEMTKWFDSSNTFQGTYQTWTGLQQMQLSIRSGVTPEHYGSPASPFRITSRNVSVDYDGTPGAYGGPGKKGVETLANAGPGDNTIAYKNGKPVIENGYYVSKTSFHRGDQTTQRNNINGSIYPYAALGNKQRFGARPGDVVYAANHTNGRGVWMVYGDYRGTRNTGLEFSPAALTSLGIPFHGNDVRPTPVTMVVYPNSVSGDFP
jgi:RHS repeat-associated protein